MSHSKLLIAIIFLTEKHSNLLLSKGMEHFLLSVTFLTERCNVNGMSAETEEQYMWLRYHKNGPTHRYFIPVS